MSSSAVSARPCCPASPARRVLPPGQPPHRFTARPLPCRVVALAPPPQRAEPVSPPPVPAGRTAPAHWSAPPAPPRTGRWRPPSGVVLLWRVHGSSPSLRCHAGDGWPLSDHGSLRGRRMPPHDGVGSVGLVMSGARSVCPTRAAPQQHPRDGQRPAPSRDTVPPCPADLVLCCYRVLMPPSRPGLTSGTRCRPSTCDAGCRRACAPRRALSGWQPLRAMAAFRSWRMLPTRIVASATRPR